MSNFKYVVFISTFFVFLFEGLVHYNIGKNGLTSFILPKISDLYKIVLILILFSFINAYISNFLYDLNK